MTSTKDHEELGKVENMYVLPKDISLRITQLSTRELSELEKTLSQSDLCSLIFLLGDQLKDDIVLEDLYYNLIVDGAQMSGKFWPFKSPGLLSKYMISPNEKYWKEKVIEALLITQNYSVLKRWHFDVNDLKIAFKAPSKWYAAFIHPLRKLLYLLCDDLCDSDWRTLCTAIALEKSLLKDDKLQYGIDFPEISLLYWSSKQIIDIKSPKSPNLSIIQKHLPCVKRDDWAAILSDLTTDNCFSILRPFASPPALEPYSPKFSKEEDCYQVSSENAGVCVIFNQKQVKGYDDREGSENDAQYLKKTFECFGFEVIQRHNTRASAIVPEILYFTQKAMSCYVIAILSHGERNVVKGSDGDGVNIDVIEGTMLRIKSLENKPKLLIIQACQADPTPSTDIATDGGRKGHLFVYMASLPGDFAYRHKVLGSYFINHLCDTLLENSENANWSEIIRLCNAKMEKETFAYLMPWHRCAFTKHLILVAKNQVAAKKVLHDQQEKRRIHLTKRT